jgi:hypothetical protein
MRVAATVRRHSPKARKIGDRLLNLPRRAKLAAEGTRWVNCRRSFQRRCVKVKTISKILQYYHELNEESLPGQRTVIPLRAWIK